MIVFLQFFVASVTDILTRRYLKEMDIALLKTAIEGVIEATKEDVVPVMKTVVLPKPYTLRRDTIEKYETR